MYSGRAAVELLRIGSLEACAQAAQQPARRGLVLRASDRDADRHAAAALYE
jgi:hypothetical protein